MSLHLYFASRFLRSFLLIFGLFALILFMVEIVENIRRFDTETMGFSEITLLTLLSLPESVYAILPLIMIIATIALFLNLARTSELVVARASGRSGFRTLMAPVAVAIILGGVALAALNPIVAATSRQYEETANRYLQGIESTLAISEEGLWLREGGPDGQTVIHASRANLDGTRLWGVTFLGLDPEGRPSYRVEAAEAELLPGAWRISGAKEWRFDAGRNPEQLSLRHEALDLRSELTRDGIRDSFGTPSAISIWDLPEFIARLDRAGFSALNHRAWFQAQLALPVTLAAMVLIGAGFTMRHTRLGRTGLSVLFAILMGFALYFVRNFSQILAENGQVPVLLAAWTPPLAAVLLALGLLLHLEDG